MVMLLVDYRSLHQNMTHGPVASAIPRCLTEIQDFWTHPLPTEKNLHFNKVSGRFISTLKYGKHHPWPSESIFLSLVFHFPKPQDKKESLGLLSNLQIYNIAGHRKDTLNFVFFFILTLPSMFQDTRIFAYGLRIICSLGLNTDLKCW